MSEWMSVKDRLPDPCKNVLVCDEYGTFVSRLYEDSSGWDTGDMWIQGSIRFWMPLPEPPKE